MLYTTHQHTTPASALDRNRHQDPLLSEILHLGQTMVGLPPLMILALSAAAMAVSTIAMAPALVQIGTALKSRQMHRHLSALSPHPVISKDQQMAAFLKVWDAEVAHLQK